MSKSGKGKSEMKDFDRKAMGNRLRDAREYLGFSQEEVARLLGIPRSALSNIETGQRKLEALELKRLAGLYSRPTSYFTNEEDSIGEPLPEDIAHLARKAADLAPDDRAELSRFVDFLSAKKQRAED